MMIFWEQRLAYLATPKTGSTAVEEALLPHATMAALDPPVLKHTTVHRYRRFLGPMLAAASGVEFEVVALMRDPRDWLGSWYRYRTRPGVPDPKKSTAGMTFEAFVNAWCDPDPPPFAAVGSQAKFLAARNGQGVDHLFRYEDIGAFTRFLARRFGRAIDLPRSNVSPAGRLDLSSETEARLRNCAAADFALYAEIPPP